MAVWPIVRTVKSGPNDAFNDTILPMSIFGDADTVDAPIAPFAVHPPTSATPTTLAKASSILGNRTRAMYRIQRPQPRNVATARVNKVDAISGGSSGEPEPGSVTMVTKVTYSPR